MNLEPMPSQSSPESDSAERPYYRVFLQNLLNDRCAANPRYSLRAFARHLQVAPGVLSSILSMKRPLTVQQAEKLLSRLQVDPAEHQKVLQSVVKFQLSRRLRRVDPRVRGFAGAGTEPPPSADLDAFHLAADWYHGAILEMTFSPTFQRDPRWVSRTLGISYHEAKSALERLIGFGLLEEVEGRLRKVRDIPQDPAAGGRAAHRRSQSQLRRKAIETAETNLDEKLHLGSTMLCIDPDLLPEARRRLEEFQRELRGFLEQGSRKVLYVLENGLLPLQRDAEPGPYGGESH